MRNPERGHDWNTIYNPVLPTPIFLKLLRWLTRFWPSSFLLSRRKFFQRRFSLPRARERGLPRPPRLSAPPRAPLAWTAAAVIEIAPSTGEDRESTGLRKTPIRVVAHSHICRARNPKTVIKDQRTETALRRVLDKKSRCVPIEYSDIINAYIARRNPRPSFYFLARV
jgi:hypothetical protein